MEPPRFVKPISGLDVPEGGQAVFEVVVAGQPLPDVAWYHEGRPIQHGPDFQVPVHAGTPAAGHGVPHSSLKAVFGIVSDDTTVIPVKRLKLTSTLSSLALAITEML